MNNNCRRGSASQPALTRLSLRRYPEITTEVSAKIARFTQLKELALLCFGPCNQNWVRDDFNGPQTLHELAKLTQLIKLELTYSKILTGFGQLNPLSNLTRLDLSENSLLKDEELSGLVDASESLRSLTLSRCELLTDRSLESISKRSRLTRLDLNECHAITGRGLLELSRRCRELTRLGMAEIEATEAEIEGITANLPNLTRFDSYRRISVVVENKAIYKYSFLSEEGFKSVAKNLPQLRTFNLKSPLGGTQELTPVLTAVDANEYSARMQPWVQIERGETNTPPPSKQQLAALEISEEEFRRHREHGICLNDLFILRLLAIYGPEPREPIRIKELAKLTSLTTLDLTDTTITERELGRLTPELTSLWELNLNYCSYLVDLSPTITCLSNLNTLALRKKTPNTTTPTYVFSDTVLQRVSELTSLTDLDISENPYYTSNGFLMLKSLTNLTTLTTRQSNRGVPVGTFEELISSVPKLRVLAHGTRAPLDYDTVYARNPNLRVIF